MKKKTTFNRNFDTAIIKAMNCQIDDVGNFKFKLIPIHEETGKESSKDSWMKYAKLKNNEIEALKSYDETIWLLSAGNSNYPLWIEINKLGENEISLEFSMRFRHLKTCHHQESNHPPFKIIE